MSWETIDITTESGERVDLSQFGVRRNNCIDDELIVRQFADAPLLMDFPGVERDGGVGPETVVRKNAKDKGQRPFCGGIASKDIGEYDTCPHQCAYCYATRSDGKAAENYRLHRTRPDAETITGKYGPVTPLRNRTGAARSPP